MANGAIKLQNSLGADLYPITPIDNVIVSSGTTATAKRTSVRAKTSADNYHFPTEYAVALVSSALSSSINTKQATISAGYGIVLDGATVSNNAATVADVMGGTAQKMVDGKALMGALTLGQAVDVTSIPDGYTSTTYNADSLNVTTTSVGFAAFPKWADGLAYIMVADFANSGTTARTITPSGGTWIEGGSAAKTLPANTTSRMAMVFSGTSASHPAKFVLTGTGVLHADMLREYEVTKCTKEAREQLVALNTKNDYETYYTVKDDMVDPWTYIINMGASPTTTVAAGLAYQINAMTGSHTLTCNACPAGYVGRETFVRILLGSTGNVIVQTPLILGTPLIANSINNCSVIYRDGQAILTVTDTLGGYIVTNTLTSGDGSLHDALQSVGDINQFVMFDYQTVGSAIPTGGATLGGSKLIMGNGYHETVITGNLNCGDVEAHLQHIGMSSLNLNIGKVATENACVLSGATVFVSSGWLCPDSGGYLELESGATVRLNGQTFSGKQGGYRLGYLTMRPNSVINGNGAVIDMNNTCLKVAPSAKANYVITGCTFTNLARDLTSTGGTADNGGVSFNRYATVDISDCYIGHPYGGYALIVAGPETNITGCTIAELWETGYQTTQLSSKTLTVTDCTFLGYDTFFSQNDASTDVTFKGYTVVRGRFIRMPNWGGRTKPLVFDSGAVIDIQSSYASAGATVIGGCGGFHFASGGATVVYSSGTGSASYSMDNVTLPAAAYLRKDGIINMGNTQCDIPTSSGTIRVDGASFIGGSGTVGYFVLRSGVDAQFYNTRFTSAVTTGDALAILSFGGTKPLVVSGCTFEGATGAVNAAGYLYLTSGTAEISDCNFVDKNTIRVLASGYATFKDCHINSCFVAGGTIAFAGSTTLSSGTITPEQSSSGQVVFSSGAILDLTGNTSGSAYVVSGVTVGTIPINPGGGIVIGSNAQIYPSAGSASAIDISGGTYTALTNGGVLLGPMHISRGETVSGNATVDLNGSRIMAPTSNTYIEGLTILNSNAGIVNGGGFNDSGYSGTTLVSMTFSGCSVTSSSTIGRGGAVALTGASASLASCTFVNNSAYIGGAVYRAATPTITLSGCAFSANTGVWAGGGCNVTGAMTLLDCNFTSNVVQRGPGGGMLCSNTQTHVISGCVFSGNSTIGANGAGGGFAVGGTTTIENCVVVNNDNGTRNGGGIWASGGTTTISNSLISGNVGNGDAYFAGNASAILTGNTVGSIVLSAAMLTIQNSNTIDKLSGSGSSTVVISSGVSITLTSSINPGGTGGITVAAGGCTVNGNVIAAGTYTSINSNGVPTA